MEIYFSTDVEADGPIPGPHSMLSFASAAFALREGSPVPAGFELLGTFSRNLTTLPGAAPHPRTMAWWASRPEAWQEARRDPVDPAVALPEYATWVRALAAGHGARPVFVAYPATYDFLFVHWYLVRFAGESPFSHSGLDVKSYAMALLGGSFGEVSKRTMPRRWLGPARHAHVALDDALEQGELFCRMLLEGRSRGA